MITRAPIINTRTNLKLNQESLDRVYLDHQVDTFKVDDDMVYQILSKTFTDTNTYVYVKQRKAMQDGQAVYFDGHKHFLGPDHVARQVAEAKGKLLHSHNDSERKTWDWDKYIALHKEQHTIMESHTDSGYSGMDNGTKVCHFLQGIKRTEFEAVVNVVHAKPEKYGTDFDTTVFIFGAKWLQRKACLQFKLQELEVSKSQSDSLHRKNRM